MDWRSALLRRLRVEVWILLAGRREPDVIPARGVFADVLVVTAYVPPHPQTLDRRRGHHHHHHRRTPPRLPIALPRLQLVASWMRAGSYGPRPLRPAHQVHHPRAATRPRAVRFPPIGPQRAAR